MNCSICGEEYVDCGGFPAPLLYCSNKLCKHANPYDRASIHVDRCPCGECSDYHLVGIGKFCQGSGFSKSEAFLIAKKLNS